MLLTGRYIIRRADLESQPDDVIIESQGLTIGRAASNELVLNHRAVSRTQLGIAPKRAIPGLRETGLLDGADVDRYWLFNLAKANGALLNGEAVEKVPLYDGDVIQVGPYLLTVTYQDETTLRLEITLISKVQLQPLRTSRLHSLTTDLKQQPTAVLAPVARSASGGLRTGLGLVSGFWPAEGQRALSVFWDKRKREAGKLESDSPLRPRTLRPYGKAQFNWRPTFDLLRLPRRAYFVLASLAALASAVAAGVIYQDAYAPRPLSRAHAQRLTPAALQTRNIAHEANANACTTCHTPLQGMHDACIACHQTSPSKNPANATASSANDNRSQQGFAPLALIAAHRDQQMGCTACHVEHLGAESAAGLLNYGLCFNCHNGAYQLPRASRTRAAGSILPLPHGGAVGYPQLLSANQPATTLWKLAPERWANVVARWQRALPQRPLLAARAYAAQSSLDQFHALHMVGTQNQTLCVTCHFNPQGTRDIQSPYGLHEAPRQACVKCHMTAEQVASGRVQGVAKCYTCHQQHGQTERPALLEPRDAALLDTYLAALAPRAESVNEFALATVRRIGTAATIRHELAAPSWENFGALSWRGWLAIGIALPLLGWLTLVSQTRRRQARLRAATAKATGKLNTSGLALTETQLRLKNEGPLFPRPVIDPLLCIGCHACVEACPHDVLAITSDGVAAPVNVDQCMEDTSCQVECPTSPKACVVVHTAKIIPERQVPQRDQQFMTNVAGIYLIGDISGVPLIKNAINEGSQVMEAVAAAHAQTKQTEQTGQAAQTVRDKADAESYDVAIIGLGPAGLAAALEAQKRGLRYLALEQDKVAATIENVYGKGKFVFFKPDSVPVRGRLPLPIAPQQAGGNFKEPMLQAWDDAIKTAQLQLNEQERCVDIQPRATKASAEGGFIITTERGGAKTKHTYSARQIVLAIGNRGTPQLLKVPGEDLQRAVQVLAKFCNNCGTPRTSPVRFCTACGKPINYKTVQTGKVQYRLTDAADYVGQHCIVVGAGNSALEVAVALTGFQRTATGFTFGVGAASVTLLIRSDLKGDLKLGNKMNFYDCLDAGKLSVQFGVAIEKIEADAVTLVDAKTKQPTGTRLPCDTVFALIGGEKPFGFLKKMGLEIRGKD